MFERDLLVALIALALGFVMIFSAVANDERAFQMRTPNYLSHSLGRSKARIIIGLIGAIVVLLGIYVLSSPFVGKQKDDSKSGRALPLTIDLDPVTG